MKETQEVEATSVEILIVGFGFAVIPLLRELDRRGQEYTLISEGLSIWEQLAKSDRLNFDLVSSFHGSVYSIDQVKKGVTVDYYPSAREFYEYQRTIFEPYRDKVITDTVTSVENHPDYSLVRTSRGRSFRANKLVFATGLGRPQNETIKNFDIGKVTGKTIVFGTIGDTANMMIARAVPQGNKVILVNNGFMALDKLIVVDSPGPKGSNRYIPIMGVRSGKRYYLDLAQIEVHTVHRYFRRFYKELFSLAFGPPEADSFLAKLLMPHVFYVRHPETYRTQAVRDCDNAKAGISNGVLVIKFWPIDTYQTLFGDELEQSIEKGMILNDITFFHTEGLVETWPKDQTSIDLENKTVSWGEKICSFDHYIGGEHEQPRLPPIDIIDGDGMRRRYEYQYRDNFLGVVPSTLHNVFFTGFTRPTTAGVANITEMQGLMVHKLLSNHDFRDDLYATIHERGADPILSSRPDQRVAGAGGRDLRLCRAVHRSWPAKASSPQTQGRFPTCETWPRSHGVRPIEIKSHTDISTRSDISSDHNHVDMPVGIACSRSASTNAECDIRANVIIRTST